MPALDTKIEACSWFITCSYHLCSPCGLEMVNPVYLFCDDCLLSILTDDEGAYVFVMSDISEYVARNVNKIANAGVNTKIVDMADFIPPKPKTTEKMCVCASLRLDAVVAATLNISRGNTEKLISSGYVKLNHREVLDRSKQVGEGDLLSIRNYGRFILKDIGNNTRKGRLHITVEKFV